MRKGKRMWRPGILALVCAGILGGCGDMEGGQAGERINEISVVRQGSEAVPGSGGASGSGEQSGAGTEYRTDGQSGAGAVPGNGGASGAGAVSGADGMSGAGTADISRRAAYRSVLEKLYRDNVLPGGRDYGGPEKVLGNMEENRFAIFDIDADGREELIIEYRTCITAGAVEMVCEYDSISGVVREVFSEYPALTFYDNGAIKADWSHNQGAGGDFWPYTLYEYDQETDSYREAGRVEAWDRSLRERIGEKVFPGEVDEDGDGIVYYIAEGEEMADIPVDGAAYESWLEARVGGAKELEVPFLNLTEEHIGAVSGGDGGKELSGVQIKEQSFEVELDGWGEVTFASFEPEFREKEDDRGQMCYGDVRFALMKEGRAVYLLPGLAVNNVWYNQQFQEIVSVAFRDYNEDGRKDILMILEYAWAQDSTKSFREARAYTQVEGGNEFILDEPVTELLCKRDSTGSMEAVYGELEDYSRSYSAATSKSVWEVERFARKVRDMILAGDYRGLSEQIAYPIPIDGIMYRDREAFLAAPFVQRTNPKALEELESENCQRMFSSWQGVMLGNGSVWIGEVLDENMVSQGLKVIGLNNLTENSGGDSTVMKYLQYGNLSTLFDTGYLAYSVPGRDGEDYRLYFFEAEDKRYEMFSDAEYRADQADITFPDVREGNAAIGTFYDIYFCDTLHLEGSEQPDLLVIARYEIDGLLYYDTRLYLGRKEGYEPAWDSMRELNETYHECGKEGEAYPVTQVMKELVASYLGYDVDTLR